MGSIAGIISVGFFDGPLVTLGYGIDNALPAVAGPFRSVAGQSWTAGSDAGIAAGQAWQAGSVGSQSHNAGSEGGQFV